MEQQNLSLGDKKMDLIYKKARQRVAFKIHLTIFVLVNLFLWNLWYFLFNGTFGDATMKTLFSITFGWLLVVIAHYLIIYKWRDKMVDNEMKKLLKEAEKEEVKEEEAPTIADEKETPIV